MSCSYNREPTGYCNSTSRPNIIIPGVNAIFSCSEQRYANINNGKFSSQFLWSHRTALLNMSSIVWLNRSTRSSLCLFRYQELVQIYSVSAEKIINDGFSYSENVKNIFLSMCDVKVSLTFTSLSLVLLLTTVLPVLFKYCYKYCYSDSRKLWAVMKGGGLAL